MAAEDATTADRGQENFGCQPTGLVLSLFSRERRTRGMPQRVEAAPQSAPRPLNPGALAVRGPRTVSRAGRRASYEGGARRPSKFERTHAGRLAKFKREQQIVEDKDHATNREAHAPSPGPVERDSRPRNPAQEIEKMESAPGFPTGAEASAGRDAARRPSRAFARAAFRREFVPFDTKPNPRPKNPPQDLEKMESSA